MRMPDVNDLIKRGDALEIVKRTSGDYVTAWSNIAALDAIDPESVRPHGRWIQAESDWEQAQHECSCCGCKWPAYARLFAYCPYCGAKMEMKEE